MTKPEEGVTREIRKSMLCDQVICDHQSCIIGTFAKALIYYEAESTDADMAKAAIEAADPLPLTDAKTSTPPCSAAPRRSSGKATKADKQDLIKYYTGLFVKSFRKWSTNPRGEVAAANREVRLRAKDNQYASIPSMHADYEALLQHYCESGIDHEVYENFVSFYEVEGYWWGKCITLTSQRKRRGFVRKVVEQIKMEKFDPEAFKEEYQEYLGQGFNECESDSEDDA
ncbi:hypothetical protein H2200_007000 [Cladophialophora chaetospira]|uniref:Uncharacterized protein n=1 Tax=Cladophialophora chaetospira TaxID=386627 RepID=A0AA38X996_9EURO|nr:hypothetical protein H2200_007000 [Cladophialophora chaetospira]